jgi:hypothetical protein
MFSVILYMLRQTADNRAPLLLVPSFFPSYCDVSQALSYFCVHYSPELNNAHYVVLLGCAPEDLYADTSISKKRAASIFRASASVTASILTKFHWSFCSITTVNRRHMGRQLDDVLWRLTDTGSNKLTATIHSNNQLSLFGSFQKTQERQPTWSTLGLPVECLCTLAIRKPWNTTELIAWRQLNVTQRSRCSWFRTWVWQTERCFQHWQKHWYVMKGLDYYRPDDGGSTYFWNVGRHSIKNTAVHPRRFWASYSSPWELEISYS